MAKQERTRKSAPQNKVKSFQDADRVIEPWDDLTDDERRIFDGYVKSREVDTWLSSDIEALTKMAKLAAEMDRVWLEYKERGTVEFTQKGHPVPSPYLAAYGQLANNYKALRQALGLSASQRGISGHKQAKRNQQDAKAAKQDNADKIASLIARPDGKS